MTTIQTDLFYQIWLSELDKLSDISQYSNKLLHDCYVLGFTPQQFYDHFIDLPF